MLKIIAYNVHFQLKCVFDKVDGTEHLGWCM